MHGSRGVLQSRIDCVNIYETKYLAVNTDAQVQMLVCEDQEVKQVDNFKYLTIARNDMGQEDEDEQGWN